MWETKEVQVGKVGHDKLQVVTPSPQTPEMSWHASNENYTHGIRKCPPCDWKRNQYTLQSIRLTLVFIK